MIVDALDGNIPSVEDTLLVEGVDSTDLLGVIGVAYDSSAEDDNFVSEYSDNIVDITKSVLVVVKVLVGKTLINFDDGVTITLAENVVIDGYTFVMPIIELDRVSVTLDCTVAFVVTDDSLVLV